MFHIHFISLSLISPVVKWFIQNIAIVNGNKWNIFWVIIPLVLIDFFWKYSQLVAHFLGCLSCCVCCCCKWMMLVCWYTLCYECENCYNMCFTRSTFIYSCESLHFPYFKVKFKTTSKDMKFLQKLWGGEYTWKMDRIFNYLKNFDGIHYLIGIEIFRCHETLLNEKQSQQWKSVRFSVYTMKMD